MLIRLVSQGRAAGLNNGKGARLVRSIQSGDDCEVLLAAGGTGGHLFPAFALAQELGRRDVVTDLVTDVRGDKYGTEFPGQAVHHVPSATLTGRSPVAMARTGLTLSGGLLRAYSLLGKIRPRVVVGFGGYPTFPPLLAARLRGISTVLHEQNAVLGRANRMLVSRVNRIATSFENVKYLSPGLESRVSFTGNPVRDAVLEAAQQPYVTPLPGGPLILVVFGGSQGARFFSDQVPPAVRLLPEDLRARLHVIQQAREEDVERVSRVYREAGVSAAVQSFFGNLPELLGQAHLVVGRAGASTISELTVIGRPAILVPLPHALDNDQLQNAIQLAESGGAWCIEQKDLPVERLRDELVRLLQAPDVLADAASRAKRQGRPDAVSRLADVVCNLGGLRNLE